MKRLGIFVFYDKQGIVDRYVEYLLEGIEKYISQLVIVCNGMVNDEGLKKLGSFTDMIYLRENTGYDAMAYKLAMTDHIGWDKVVGFDEVLMFNDTYFGPIYPFSEVFDCMDQEQCDFWGMTYHEKANDYFFGTDGYMPTHLHTFFVAYRNNVLRSEVFQQYWNEFDSTGWFFSDVARHEQHFTQFLEEHGFSWKAYVDTAIYNQSIIAYNVNPYFYLASNIIKKQRCPLIKRKNFTIKNMSMQAGNAGQDIADALRFIEEKTDYPVEYIWENILRLYNITEIKNALHKDYVLPYLIDSKQEQLLQQAVICVYISSQKWLSGWKDYLSGLNGSLDVYMLVQDGIDITLLDDLVLGNEHFSVVACDFSIAQQIKILCELADKYEYVGYISDVIPSHAGGPFTMDQAYLYNKWENILRNDAYISQVLQQLKNEEQLGCLVCPIPNHANYLGMIDQTWGESYDEIVDFARSLDLKANFSLDIPCISNVDSFWVKSKALKPQWNNILEKLESGVELTDGIMRRIMPYLAQDAGYYTGCVMNVDYASLQITNLQFYLSGMMGQMKKQIDISDYDSIFESNAVAACQGKQNVVIYGAGSNGIKASNCLKKHEILIKGFVVSDDQPPQTEKNGFPIYRLSELPFEKKDLLIIICVGYTRERKVILDNLTKAGYRNYYIW